MAGPVNELKAKFGANASELLNVIKKLKTEMSTFAQSTSSSLKIANSGMSGFSTSINKLKSNLAGLGKADQFKGLTSALEAAQREFRETGSISENTMRMVREEADRARAGLSQLGDQGGQSLNQLESQINEAEAQMNQLAGVNLNPVTGEINNLGDASQDTAGQLNDLGQAGSNANLDDIGADADNASGNLDQLGDAAQDANNELSDLGGNNNLEDVINDAEDASNGMEDLENETDQAGDLIDDLSDQDLNPLIDEIDEANDEIEDLGDQDLNPLIDDLDQAQDEVDDLGDEANETGNKFDGLKGKIMGLVGAYLGFEAIKEGAKLAGSAFILANADMETYENTLTTVLKSNEKAKETLNWANEFAGQTPFEIPEIVEATTRLSAYGMNAKDVMTDIGNMASVMGTPLMQAVEAVADAQTGELERLKEFGITKDMLIEQAAKMGNKEVVNAKGQIVQQEQFNEALFALMDERYKGGMAMQAKTFKGLLSNVQDGLGTMGRELGKPIFDKFKKGLESVVPLVSGVTELIKGNAGEASNIFTKAFGADKTALIFTFINGAKTAFSEVKNFVMGLMPTFQNLWTIFQNVAAVVLPPLIAAFGVFMQLLPPILEAITGVAAKFTEWSGFAPILSGLIAAFVTYKTTMTAIGIVQKGLALATSAYIALQNAWRAAMIMSAIAGGGLRGVMVGMQSAMIALNLSFLSNPIVLLVAAIVGLGVAMVVAYKKSETFRNFVNNLWESIKGAGQWIANFFTTTIPNALSAFGSWASTFFPGLWNSIVSGVVSFGSTVGTFFSNIWTGFINILNSFWTTVWGAVTNGFNFVVNIFRSVGSTISGVASSIWSFVSNAFMTGINNIMNVFSPLVEWFSTIWTNIKTIFLSVVLAILSLVTGNFTDLKFSLTAIWQSIKNMFNATITAIKTLAVNIFTALKNTVMKVFETLKTGASNIWNSVKKTATTIWTALKTSVVNAANSLKTGAINAWNSLKSGVINAANSLKTGAINAWNALKTGAINAVNALKSGAVNAFNSLKSSASSIVNNIKSTVTSGFNNAKTAAVNAFNALKSGVSNAISGVKSTVSGMKTSIVNTIKGISLRSIGVNIINGLRDGIASAAGAVMDKARSIAKGIKDTISNALKIKSPSRAMIEIGQYVGSGLAKGLDNGKKLVGNAARKLADKVYDEAKARITNAAKLGKITLAEEVKLWKATAKIANLSAADKRQAQEKAAAAEKKLAAKRAADMKAYEQKVAKGYTDASNKIKTAVQKNTMSAKQEVTAWNNLVKKYKSGSKQQLDALKNLNAAKKKVFNEEKQVIKDKADNNQYSLTQELKAWENLAKKYKAGSAERKEAEANAYKVKQEINNKLKDLNADYLKNVQDTNAKLVSETKALNDEYQKAVNDRANALTKGAFDEVKEAETKKTGKELIDNLKAQKDQLEQYGKGMADLKKKGVSEGILEELQAMGVDGLAEIQAMQSMTPAQITEFNKVYQQREQLARDQANKELEQMKKDTDKQIKALEAQAKKDLTGYKNSWIQGIQEINKGSAKEISNTKLTMTQIGKETINGMINGMKSVSGALKGTATDMANSITKAIKGALNIKSPSRVLEQLGIYTGEGLNEGLGGMIKTVAGTARNMAEAVTDNMNINGASLGGSLYGESLTESRLLVEHLIDLTNVPDHINPDQLKGMFMDALQDPRIQVAIDRAGEKAYGRVIRPQGGF